MTALGAAITVHSLRIYHKFEILSILLQPVNQLQSILKVNIVITCAMSQTQHIALVSLVIAESGIYGCFIIPVRVILRRIHISFGVMRIIQSPVIYSATGNSIFKVLTSLCHCQSSHSSTVRKTFNTYFVLIYERHIQKILYSVNKVL